MKKNIFLLSIALLFLIEIGALLGFAVKNADYLQDAVKINEAVQSVQAEWDTIQTYEDRTGLDYVVINRDGSVVFRTGPELSENVNAAVIHRDTILDIEVDGLPVGKIIIYNGSGQSIQSEKRKAVTVLLVVMVGQFCICIGYLIFLHNTIIRPFQKLKDFARRVAGGNLDIPLTMDRQNLFGAFTESFDIMRAELKRARKNEAEANASKKELVAKLSHDIRTPVASIKAASELGAACADNEKTKHNYIAIAHKADQINTLVTNLLTSTLEELTELSVTPANITSRELKTILESSDYLHCAVVPDIPECLLYADILRLQQVFDNIFANSYKYVNTKIDITIQREGKHLIVAVEDYGGGIHPEELPFMKEKFRRGSNAKDVEGAGLGLYISDYFMTEMQGELLIENGRNGLKVTVCIPLSGTI